MARPGERRSNEMLRVGQFADHIRSNGYAAQLSNSTYNVTSARFLGWNPNIQGSCDDLAIDQRICIRFVWPNMASKIQFV